MSERDTVHHAASALRTALGGKVMVAFDAISLAGPAPSAGRIVERVEHRGRHLQIEWDDGLVLDTNLRLSGSWDLYRRGERWRIAHHDVRVVVTVDEWVAVCARAPVVETYRVADRRRHPGMGRLGPDLGSVSTDLGCVVNLLLTYPDPHARLGDVLLDHRVMTGIGNVDRCEALWADELSPFAPVGALGESDAVRIVNTAASTLRAHLPGGSTAPGVRPLAVYGRNGQPCIRCTATVAARRSRRARRLLYWCPGCQRHLDPQAPSVDDTPMDPHPAAARFLADLPWNRRGDVT